jgi:exodeoxyribonuclease-3
MKLLSWNVNGLRAVHKKGFMDWLASAGPDALCLQEVKCLPEQVPEDIARARDYFFDINSAEKKGYSGVATLSRIQPTRVDKGFGVSQFDSEGRVLVYSYPSFTLFNIYFPNGKMNSDRLEFKMGFYEQLLKVIEEYRKRGEDKIVICGDVNTAHAEIDLALPKENSGVSGFLPRERAWIDKLLSRGFVDTFREFEKTPGHYSWWDMVTRARERNVGWRIDYFFISENLRPHLKNAFILPEVFGSDHCPVGIELF